ncbi:hypothetical protein N0V82_003321 [Gnomoniopsis sp. IMI 355080]|nr:hypothetical protein N0V82_003321 [Gnomoniopsis sp. IMI 355080]
MHIFNVQAPPAPAPAPAPINTPRRAPSHRRSRSQSPHATANLNLKKRIRKSISPPRRKDFSPCLSNNLTVPTVSLASFSAPRDSFDPSGYKFRDVLRATCVDAAESVRNAEARIPAADRAMVELPSGRQLVYDNALDVLHLRFLNAESGAPLSSIFRSLWSPALATALHSARRVAIDVSQIWPELAQEQHKLVQDIVFLVCTLQNNLEVLYLVDYSQQHGVAPTLASKDSDLYSRFHSYGPERAAEKDRAADVIHGNGTVWREVFDLERMGWHERHPGFVFGEMFGEVVRLQQGQWFGEGEKKSTFRGVRVLVAEHEIGGVNNDRMDES